MDAGGGGADEVSRPEKALPFWLKPLLSLRHPPQPPPGKQIRPEEEVSVGSTNRFLTQRGQRSTRILPVARTDFSADLRVITHVPARSPSKGGSWRSSAPDQEPLGSPSLLYQPFGYISKRGRSAKRLRPCQESHHLTEKSPECRWAGKDKHNSAKPESVTCLLAHPQECPHASSSAEV